MGRKAKAPKDQDPNLQEEGVASKYKKHLSSEWMDTAETYSTDEIKKWIVQWEQAISSTEKDMDADPKLNGYKEKIADLNSQLKDDSSVYKQTIAESGAKIRYLVFLLEKRGVVVS